jgi:NAD(P)H-flavin reductase
MHVEKGQVLELILRDGLRHARVTCSDNLIPAPGQYLLASDISDSTLPIPIFLTDSSTNGFISASPIPDSWNPGRELYLRGPLGKGFSLPLPARRVGLVAFESSPSRLHGLIQPSLRQGASVVLVGNSRVDSLPEEVEVQPQSALSEIIEWADYIAFDVKREKLPYLREQFFSRKQANVSFEAQVLVRTPMPCGGIAECGVCAVTVKSDWKMACKDGPVFDWRDLA